MPSAYIIANVTVNNQDQYQEYKRLSSIAMKTYRAEVCTRGGKVEVLEGDWTPDRVVVLKFPGMDEARSFYHSAEYGAAIQARKDISTMRMVLVEGI
jgi:uncharacterized protein (DUF1330 family)